MAAGDAIAQSQELRGDAKNYDLKRTARYFGKTYNQCTECSVIPSSNLNDTFTLMCEQHNTSIPMAIP